MQWNWLCMQNANRSMQIEASRMQNKWKSLQAWDVEANTAWALAKRLDLLTPEASPWNSASWRIASTRFIRRLWAVYRKKIQMNFKSRFISSHNQSLPLYLRRLCKLQKIQHSSTWEKKLNAGNGYLEEPHGSPYATLIPFQKPQWSSLWGRGYSWWEIWDEYLGR